MSSPQDIWNENPLKRLAERSFERPGVYLIALREHLKRGKVILGNFVNTVSEALPDSRKAQPADDL